MKSERLNVRNPTHINDENMSVSTSIRVIDSFGWSAFNFR